LNVVDSSGWLEYFANGPNASFFAPAIEATRDLIVPTLSLYEVFKRVIQQRGESQALQAVALMQQGQVVDLTAPIALAAVKASIQHRLPMADSIMLAPARSWNAVFWSQDVDFSNIAGVKYVVKKAVV
jgi:predicted nucleic acid-binding protein